METRFVTKIERSPNQRERRGAKAGRIGPPSDSPHKEVASGRTDACRCVGAIIFGGTHGSLSIARSLGRRGIRVWLIETGSGIARFSRHVEKRLAWPGPRNPNALNWLLDLADRHDLRGWVLFPAAEPDACFMAENLDALATRFRLNSLPWEVMRQVQDKSLLYRKAEELGLDCPRTYWADRATGLPDPGRFPVVVKPAVHRGRGGPAQPKAWRADDRESFLELYAGVSRRLADVIAQELIPGDCTAQFSYAGLWHAGQPVAWLVARRLHQHPVEFGTGTLIETVENPDVERAAELLLRSLGYHGLVEIEFKRDDRDSRHKIIDVNTGVCGWIGLGEAAGIDFPWLAWRLATGDVPASARGQIGRSWRYLPRDVFAMFLGIATGTLTVGDALKSLARRSAGASFAQDDILPALVDVPLVAVRLMQQAFGILA